MAAESAWTHVAPICQDATSIYLPSSLSHFSLLLFSRQAGRQGGGRGVRRERGWLRHGGGEAHALGDAAAVEEVQRRRRAVAAGALALRRLLDEDVVGVSVDVEEAYVEDADAVHGCHGEPRRAELAGVVLVCRKALDRGRGRR